MRGVNRALRYLNGISNTELLLKPDEDANLSAHIDANWGGKAHEKRRSRNDILTRYGSSVVYAASSL